MPEAADGEALEVVLHDFTLEVRPATTHAGVRIQVANLAARARHELVVFRLPDADLRTARDLAALSPPALVAALGEPVTVLLTTPNGPTVTAVGDGCLTAPGRYVLLCFIPTRLAPAKPRDTAFGGSERSPATAGTSEVSHGMYAELTVE